MIKLYNTFSRKKEIFKPIKNKKIGLYACGPTVYWYAHIGNLRTYIFEDILKRVLEYNEYKVNHVMNITDVGHLISNEDTGEDKMEIGAKREKKTAWQIAKFYANAFKKDLKKLNILSPSQLPKATDHIKEQIEIIKILEKKGFVYEIEDGVYFDTSKLKDYGKLANLKKQKLKAGSRVEIVEGKKNPADFALWKFSPIGTKRQMEWNSPWAPPDVRGKVKGFPGWHTECVAMSIKYLGIPFDIHCGGIDHISIHHTNEIAQAEAVFGKNLTNFWLHANFLTLKGGRIGKSEGNIILVDDLIKNGFNPLSFRYLCLTTHYRSKLDFSREALKASQNALDNLYKIISKLKVQSSKPQLKNKNYKNKTINYKNEFLGFINNDLDMPKALALAWKLIKDEKMPSKEKHNLLIDFDKVFGFDLAKAKIKKDKIPHEIKNLALTREKHRQQKNWQKSDKIRKKIEQLGWQIEDTKQGPKIKKLK